MSKLVKTVLHQFHAGIAPWDYFKPGFAQKIAYDATDPDQAGLFGNKFETIGRQVAPIALSFIPGVGALAAAGYSALSNYGQTGNIGSSLLKGGLSYLGSSIGGALNGAGSAASGALDDVPDSFLNATDDEIANAVTPTTALGRIASSASNAVKDTGLGNVFNDASGAVSDAYGDLSNTISDAYKGSSLQSIYDSGKDALKSFGIGSSDTVATPAPSTIGGASSSYSIPTSNLQTPQFGTASGITNPSSYDQISNADIDNLGSNIGNSSGTASAINTNPTIPTSSPSIGGKVASNILSQYVSPLASIGIGTLTNNAAEDALLKQQKINQGLLSPYKSFSFTPGDLTQDPGYQFNLAQGNQALDRKQAATGNYFSGEALKEAQQFGQGLADNTYNQAYTRALQGFNSGLTGAEANAGINTNIGNIKAGADTNEGNLFSGALGSVLGGNAFSNSGALQGQAGIPDWLRSLIGYGR